METAQKPALSLADLFKPLAPADSAGGATPVQAQGTAPVASQEAQKPANAVGGTPGTLSQEALNSSLKHTEISSVSGPAVPGQGTAPGAPIGTPGSSVSLGGMVQGEWAVNIMDALLPPPLWQGSMQWASSCVKVNCS